MKKCPTCENTFDDNLRFCQADGTPLVDISEAASDPYKTIVSNQNEISAPPLDPFKTMVGTPLKKDEDDLLQLPDAPDFSKTMAVSQDEMNEQSAGAPPSPFDNVSSGSGSVREDSDAFSAPPLDLPKFNEPTLSPPSFGDLSSQGSDLPASPPKSETNTTDSTLVLNTDSVSDEPSGQSNYGKPANDPIPSPFDAAPSTSYEPPAPPFKEPEPPFGAQNNPFNQSPFEPTPTPFGQQSAPYNAPMQQTEWTPPPAPEANWQNQNIGANTPFQPPVAVQGQNQTLPIVSLVCGIISLFCCWLGFLLGPAALITGFMGRNNANRNPSEYGGNGLALAGMITGGIGTLISVAYFILIGLGGIARILEAFASPR